MKICSKCQAECEDQMKFCLNCGTPFEEPAPSPENPEPVLELPDELKKAVKEEEPKEAELPDELIEEISRPTKPIPAASVFAASESEPSKPISDASAAAPESEPSKPIPDASAAAPASEPSRPVPAAPAEEYDDEEYDDEYDDDEEELTSGKVKKTMSVFSVLSVIFGIIGVFTGGYACLLSFLNILIALAFYLPSVLAIVFGLLALRSTGRGRKHKGRILAFLGIILGVLSLVLWVIGTFYLRGVVAAEFGTMDLMSVVRVITTKL